MYNTESDSVCQPCLKKLGYVDLSNISVSDAKRGIKLQKRIPPKQDISKWRAATADEMRAGKKMFYKVSGKKKE